MEDNYEIKFTLRDYQEDASNNIDEIYDREELNRFAAVILPTGGGKSFVAMMQLLKMNNPNYKSAKRNGEINPSKMLYCAPSYEILSQIKTHIVKNIIFSIPNLEELSIEEINNKIKQDYPQIDFKGINNDSKNHEMVYDNSSAKEKLNAILRSITSEQIDDLVLTAFPNLKFKCYAGVKEKEKKESTNKKDILTEQDVLDSEFIVLDEAHRLGSEKWGANVEKIIGKAQKAKILAITATPERQDKLGKEMMSGIAKMVYPDEIVTRDKYIAKEMYVLDAMRDGIVNSPEVVEFNASLAFLKGASSYETMYKMAVNAWRKASERDKGRYEKILDEMEEIIGISSKEYPDRMIPSKELELMRKKLIRKTIHDNIKNINGKFIVFIPDNRTKNGEEKGDTKAFFEKYIKEIHEYFDGIVDENGKPVEISIDYVSSDKSLEKENAKKLKDFEGHSNVSGGIKIMISQKKLNEGVHIEGIDGAIMLSPSDSSITYLQQSGRCISSMDPSKPLDEQQNTQLFDFVGNGIKEIRKGTGQKKSHSYELYRLIEINNWIINNDGKIPDINAVAGEEATDEEKAKCEYEARLACSLKRLRAREITYKRDKSYPIEDSSIVEQFITLAEQMNIESINIGMRTVEPSEEELLGKSFLSFTDKQERFMELVDELMTLKRVRASDTTNRVVKLMNILRILKAHKENISLPPGIMTREKVGTKMAYVKTADVGNGVDLEDFIRANFEDENEIKEIMYELQDAEIMGANNRKQVYHRGEHYNFGKELAYARGEFYTSRQTLLEKGTTPISNYSLREIVNLGIFDITNSKTISDIYEMFGISIDDIIEKNDDDVFFKKFDEMYEKGVILRGNPLSIKKYGLLKQFEEYSINKLRKYNDKGLDRDGYNEHGFKQIDSIFINKETGRKYDKYGYRMVFDYKTEKFVYRLMPEISSSRVIMTRMINQGMSFDEVCEEYAERAHISKAEATKRNMRCLRIGFEIYKEYPEVFGEDVKGEKTDFEGLDSLLNPRNSEEKLAHIEELYKICYPLRKIILDKTQKLLEQIEELEKKATSLTDNEKEKLEEYKYLKETFDNLGAGRE